MTRTQLTLAHIKCTLEESAERIEEQVSAYDQLPSDVRREGEAEGGGGADSGEEGCQSTGRYI